MSIAALLVAVSSTCPSVAPSFEDPPFLAQSRALRDALVRLGATPAVDPESGDLARVTFERVPEVSGVRYAISSDNQTVEVACSDAAGAAQAAATLLRRAEIDGERVGWSPFVVFDTTPFTYRSFMVDMGRNPHGPELLRQVVDMLWFYRANVLHLHLTDDQLISWPSKAFPKLCSERAGWTWDDFVALEAYAEARGVMIVPEIDVPGHSTILRREYPEVFGETPTDLASDPEAQQGVQTLIDEMLSVFRSTKYVHIGGDEAYGVPEELQRDFINRLNRFVVSRGRRTVVWEGPRCGEGENKVDTDVLHINWRTIAFPAQEMLDAGYEVVNAAWDPMYIVDHYPRTMFTAVEVQRCYEWEPRRFQHINAGIPTFANPHEARSDEGIVGFCMPWWEGREENLMALCLPRFAAVATAAWDLERESGFDGFRREYEESLPRLLAVSGIELPQLPMAPADSQSANLAYGCAVTPSAGATQPHFGPQRLTNGLTDRFDHFLGFPTTPEPLEIVVDLGGTRTIGRVVVHETAVRQSYERYRVEVSVDGAEYFEVGASGEGSRGEASFVEHSFEAREARFVRVVTDGCQNLTFPSFSRLVEIEVFAAR